MAGVGKSKLREVYIPAVKVFLVPEHYEMVVAEAKKKGMSVPTSLTHLLEDTGMLSAGLFRYFEGAAWASLLRRQKGL